MSFPPSSSSSAAFPFPFVSFFFVASFFSTADFVVGRGAKKEETGGFFSSAFLSFVVVAGFEEDVEAEVEGFEGDAEGFGSVLGFSSFFFFAGEGVASSVDDRGQLAARK